MSKICIKCNKSVYPLEELKCLDKIWHKTCFKCWDCGMSLNIKNYKGYDKKPYCSAHYPQIKATMVADTPELTRVAQNTRLQSQVKYHEDFEKNIKGSKIEVSDDPEVMRVSKVNHLVSQLEYKDKDKAAAAARLEERRQSLPQTMTGVRTSGNKWTPPGSVASNGGAGEEAPDKPSPYSSRSVTSSTLYSSSGKVEGTPRVKRVGSIADYDPVNDNYGSLTQGYRPSSTSSQSHQWEETVPVSPAVTGPTSPAISTSSSVASTSGVHTTSELEQSDPDQDRRTPADEVFGARGSEHLDGDGNTTGPRLLSLGATNGKGEHTPTDSVDETMVATMEKSQEDEDEDEGTSKDYGEEVEEKEETVVKERSPVRTPDHVSSPVHAHSNHAVSEEQIEREEEEEEQVTVDSQQELKQEGEEDEEPGTSVVGAVFSALYEYEAGDDDEVGFSESDEVIDVRIVDDGWMYGTVSRTGQRGLFPSNYVERIA